MYHKFQNPQVGALAIHPLLKNRGNFFYLEDFNSYFVDISMNIISTFDSNVPCINLTNGWVNVYNKTTHINSNEIHNHADHEFMKNGNYVLIQVLETGKYEENVTVLDKNNAEIDVPVSTGDVLVFSAYTMHGLKETKDRLRVAAFAINL
jgi:hypothetical protein